MIAPFFAILLIKDFILTQIAITSRSAKLIDLKIIISRLAKNLPLVLTKERCRKNNYLV